MAFNNRKSYAIGAVVLVYVSGEGKSVLSLCLLKFLFKPCNFKFCVAEFSLSRAQFSLCYS